MNKLTIALLFVLVVATFGNLLSQIPNPVPNLSEYPDQNQVGNNINNPTRGSAGIPLSRLNGNYYNDGTSEPRGGNPSFLTSGRNVSNFLFTPEVRGENPPNRQRNQITDIATFWGQFLDHDLSLTLLSTDCESFRIQIPEGDFYRGREDMEFCKSNAIEVGGILEQINSNTAFIDASNVYGTEERLQYLRTFQGGLMKTEIINGKEFLPQNINEDGEELLEMENAALRVENTELRAAGDVRANHNPVLHSIHTLFLREHNRLARELASIDNSLTDEQLFQAARKYVTGFMQKITFEDWVPALLGKKVCDYTGYDPNVDPGIFSLFSSAILRFGHDLVNSVVLRLDATYYPVDTYGNTLLRDSFFFPDATLGPGIASLIRGSLVNLQGELNHEIIDDLRVNLFRDFPNDAFDLVALNIQRARDHGVPSYNEARRLLGLPSCTDYSCLTNEPRLLAALEELYGPAEQGIDYVDPFVGLISPQVPGSILPEFHETAFLRQLQNVRDGDRFWYENPGVFTPEQLAEIRSTTLGDIIVRNTEIDRVPPNVFLRADRIILPGGRFAQWHIDSSVGTANRV